MYAMAFDLDVAETDMNHPKSVVAAYADIRKTMRAHGFGRAQGSVYVQDATDLAGLHRAIIALKALPWFGVSVRDIRAFRVEEWSDFTSIVKTP